MASKHALIERLADIPASLCGTTVICNNSSNKPAFHMTATPLLPKVTTP
jgi:hypothetical protein